jgi:hypothetical protein
LFWCATDRRWQLCRHGGHGAGGRPGGPQGARARGGGRRPLLIGEHAHASDQGTDGARLGARAGLGRSAWQGEHRTVRRSVGVRRPDGAWREKKGARFRGGLGERVAWGRATSRRGWVGPDVEARAAGRAAARRGAASPARQCVAAPLFELTFLQIFE